MLLDSVISCLELHFETIFFEKQVKDLEKKLKERGKESLSNTVALEQKVVNFFKFTLFLIGDKTLII